MNLKYFIVTDWRLVKTRETSQKKVVIIVFSNNKAWIKETKWSEKPDRPLVQSKERPSLSARATICMVGPISDAAYFTLFVKVLDYDL